MLIQKRRGAYAVNKREPVIGIIGLGYVGLAYALAFSLHGFRVVGVDISKERIEAIKAGYAEGFPKEAILKSLEGSLELSTSYDSLRDAEVVFIAVNTPTNPNGSQDLSQIISALNGLSEVWRDNLHDFRVIALKSTVLPGTTRGLAKHVLNKLSTASEHVGFVHCPEFLRSDKPLEDVLKPFRVVIGGIDERSSSIVAELFKELYRRIGYDAPIFIVSPEEAEMIKYASNVFLALKTVYGNLAGLVCREIENCDALKVMDIVGLDPRIGKSHIMPGMPYGGPCLVKDTSAFGKFVLERTRIDFVKRISELNELFIDKMIDSLEMALDDLRGKRVAVLGIVFKIGSSDVKDSPAISLSEKLLAKGAYVYIDDINRKALESAQILLKDVRIINNYEELKSMDAILITVGYKEYEQALQHVNDDALIIDVTGTLKDNKVLKFYSSAKKT
jgi:UDPglucose 6-dehydrogenase